MSKLLVIVEGPTGAGKSTLVARLSKALRLPAIHRAAPPSRLKDPAVVLEWYQDALLQRVPEGLILDRWVYSNNVYAPILKNQPKVSIRPCERMVLDTFEKCVTIWLTDTPEALARRIARRDKPTWTSLKDPDTLKRLVAGYDAVFNRCNLPKFQLSGDARQVLAAARKLTEEENAK